MSNIDIGHMFYFKLISMNISKKEKIALIAPSGS